MATATRQGEQTDASGLVRFARCAKEIVEAREPNVRRWRSLAPRVRLVTIALIITGFVLVWLTPKPQRIAPRWVQGMVAGSLLTFCLVGFWMLCRLPRKHHVIPGLFCIAGLVGSLIYVLATYANLALGSAHLDGGVVAGWMADIMFLPATAALLPTFLSLVPDGTAPPGRLRVVVPALTVCAVLLLFAAALFEPHLISQPGQVTPIGSWTTSKASGPLDAVGLAVFAVALGVSFWSMRVRLDAIEEEESGNDPTTAKPDPRTAKILWYRLGGAVSLVALAPYVLTASVKLPYVPDADALARAWGAVVAVAIPVTAVPAVLERPWPVGWTRHLLRAAVLAAIVAALHEWLVIQFADQLIKDPRRHPESNLVYAYVITLLIAVFIEPIIMGLHRSIEWVWDRIRRRRDPSKVLLEEALVKVQLSRDGLDKALKRRQAWARKYVRGTNGEVRQSNRKQRAILRTLGQIDAEATQAQKSLDHLKKAFEELERQGTSASNPPTPPNLNPDSEEGRDAYASRPV